MNYFKLSPEVPGGFDDGTEIDRSKNPPVVLKLNFYFDDWFESDIVTSFPVFAVTEKLRWYIEKSDLTGYEFDEIGVSTSLEFESLSPGVQLPKFYWLKISGEFKKDDFFMSEDNKRLIVSHKALEVLRKGNLKECGVTKVSI